jgi:hypothetical protein
MPLLFRRWRLWLTTQAGRLKVLSLGLVLAVLALGLLYWWWAALYPAERMLVGRWYRIETDGFGQEVLMLFEFRSDRTVSIGIFRWPSGEPYHSASGRWSLRDDTLTLDAESRLVSRIARALSDWSNLSARWFDQDFLQLQQDHVISLTSEEFATEEFDLFTGGRLVIYRRYAGDWQLPDQTIPPGE